MKVTKDHNMTNYTITTNTKYNSIEITFTDKPNEETRAALKELKFRWNPSRGIWYGFADPETLSQSLEDCEPLTADDLPNAETVEKDSLYEGWRGGNNHKWHTDDELKTLLLKDFKRAGINATIRKKRAGYLTAIAVTIKVSADEVKTFDEWRNEYDGNDINFINYKMRSFVWCGYYDDESHYHDIHIESLNAMPRDEERAALEKNIIETMYKTRVKNITESNSGHGDTFTEMLKPGAAKRVSLAQSIVATYNHDQTNTMIDYFDRDIYDDYCVKII